MLRKIDGFDFYATDDLPLRGYGVSGDVAIGASSGRRGGGALVVAKDGAVSIPVEPAGTIILGVAFYASALTNGNQAIKLMSGSTPKLVVEFDSAGGIKVTKEDGSLVGQSSGYVLPVATFLYFEIKAHLNATTGDVTIHTTGSGAARDQDGVPLPSVALSLTGINTGTGLIDTVALCGPSAAGANKFDDLYVCDTAAGDISSGNNDFLGDSRVDTQYPKADGKKTDCVPTPSGDNFPCINEHVRVPANYVEGFAADAQDFYQLDKLGAVTGKIKGVQITVAAKRAVAEVEASLYGVADLNGTEYWSDELALDATVKHVTALTEIDPKGDDWTVVNFNNAQFGFGS